MTAPATSSKPNFVQDRLPFVIATGGEFVGLYFWLAYWDSGHYILATLVLWAGFLTERIVVLGWVGHFQGKMEAKYPDQPVDKSADDFKNKPKPLQFVHLLLITLSEITIWVTVVYVFDRFFWVPALAVLILGEQLQHSLELALIAHRRIGQYIPTWNALKITLLEAIGGIIWIALVRHDQPQLGGLFLLLGLSIEHVVQAAKIEVDLEATFKAGEAAMQHVPAAPSTGVGSAS